MAQKPSHVFHPVVDAGTAELLGSVLLRKMNRFAQGVQQIAAGGLHKLAHDHGGSRGHGGAAVGNAMGVGLCDQHLLVGDMESLCRDLA